MHIVYATNYCFLIGTNRVSLHVTWGGEVWGRFSIYGIRIVEERRLLYIDDIHG